jgi:hypothetical protein
MKFFLAILAVTFFVMPAHNLRAGIKFGSTNFANTMQSNLSPQGGGQSLSPASLMERLVAQQKDVSGDFLDQQARLKSRRNKADAPNSQIYLPDSLTLYSMSDTLRMSASYNLRGWNDQIFVQVWLSGHWVNYTRDTWTYLTSNGNSLDLYQVWSNGQWVNSTLDSSTYDANGNMLVHLFKYWSQGAWKDSILSSRTYDAHGSMLTNAGWYMINNQWTNHDRFTYTNDSSGNNLSSLFQLWIGGVWVNQELFNYTYDGNGHMLTRWMQVWNGQWQNATLSTYTYDANGNMMSYLLQNSANGQWTNYTINTYTYDANGNMLTDWYKGWTNGAWMNGSLTTYTYDTNGNMVNEVIQEWLNGLWTNYRHSTFTYDVHGNELTGNNTMWSGSSWVPTDYNFALAVSGSTYNFTGYRIIISWILVNTTDISTDRSTIVKGYSLSQNYPNPFNPTTTIRYGLPHNSFVTLTVYNTLGQQVAQLVNEQQQAGYHDAMFRGDGLASGVYFYRIQAGDFVAGRKLLLLK